MVAAVSAFTIGPDRGSEPLAGWQWLRAIARVTGAPVCVVTRPRVEERLQARYGGELRRTGITFESVDVQTALRRRLADGRTRLLYYALWQYEVASLKPRPEWTSVHHVTFASSILPVGVAALRLPTIVGPISAVDSPFPLVRGSSLAAGVHDRLHLLLRRAAPHVVPLVRRALQAETVVVTPGSDPRCGARAGRRFEAPPLVVDTRELQPNGRGGRGRSLRAAVVGRMIYWKGHELALTAAAELAARRIDVRWTFIGDGPERARLERRARELGLDRSIDFAGWLPRTDALAALAGHDLLVHPAYREGWGGAVLEAMGLGLPAVCLDWGGPGAIAASGGAEAVSVGSPQTTAKGIADAVERLSDARVRDEAGDRARAVVEQCFSEEALDRHVAAIYAATPEST